MDDETIKSPDGEGATTDEGAAESGGTGNEGGTGGAGSEGGTGGAGDGGEPGGGSAETPRTPNRDKHLTVGNMSAIVNTMYAGGIPGTAITPGTVPTEAMAEGSISAAVIADKSITAAKLGDDVWAKVEEIMDEGFGEILNGEY